jgi:hypothetical protein
MALSPLLRENLDSLTGNLEILERGYVYGVQEAPKTHALGVLEMIRSELQAQMAVIAAELEWQEGQIDAYEHQQRFHAALHSRNAALLEGDEKFFSR